MIRYSLQCQSEHSFEAWFRDSAAYDAQKTAGEVICPVCGTGEVEKKLMAPSLAASSVGKRLIEDETSGGQSTTGDAAMPQNAQAMFQPPADIEKAKTFFRDLRKYVRDNADYVGDKFAEEARRIHFNEAKARGIYGESTLEEAQALQEEGIDVVPFPALPEDQN